MAVHVGIPLHYFVVLWLFFLDSEAAKQLKLAVPQAHETTGWPQGNCSAPPTAHPAQPTLTAGRAKKETPMSVKVAASSRPFQVWGYLSP